MVTMLRSRTQRIVVLNPFLVRFILLAIISTQNFCLPLVFNLAQLALGSVLQHPVLVQDYSPIKPFSQML
jgi:hypothetical protein